MLVFHCHWQPADARADPAQPGAADRPGGMVFWAETSEGSPPAWLRGRLPRSPKPAPHPFAAPPEQLAPLLSRIARRKLESVGELTLRLPSTRSGPQPSPRLAHAWDLDSETPPFLAPWVIPGLRVSPGRAVRLLVQMPASGQDEAAGIPFGLGDDWLYWRSAATLVLEALAAHKLAPVLEQSNGGKKIYQARWLPVLDQPRDGPRLALLERAMPPLCRAEAVPAGESLAPATPHTLLLTFIQASADALARYWGKNAAPGTGLPPDDAARAWVTALFQRSPVVKGAAAPLQALAASQRAWLRNLHVAGGEAFRIAFRLEAPPVIPQAEDALMQTREARSARPQWQLHFLLQARDDPSLLVPAEAVWQARGELMHSLGRPFDQPQEKLLAGLGYAARLFPPIAGSLKDKRPGGVSLETQQAYSFLRHSAPLLEGAGFGLLVPPWWNKPGARLGMRLRLQSNRPRQSAQAVVSGGLSMENLVQYRWEISIGDTTLTEAEFRSLAALKSPLVQIRGQWVQLDAEQVNAAIQFWEKQTLGGDFSLLEALQYSLGVQEEQAGLPVEQVVADDWLQEWLDQATQSEPLVELPQPQGLQAVLRPYQRYGYSWLSFLRRYGLGACLADDMGLGKTIQTIALLLHEKESLGSLPAPTLLVCPTSVVTNWEREVQRFAPQLTYLVHQGAGRLRGQAFIEAAQAVDLVLTSYALVRQDAEAVQAIQWLGVILDEAQNIKNPSARQTQAAGQLKASFRLALTGTPVENRLSELWSIMHFLNPAYLGPRQEFRRRFAIPIERYQDAEAIQRLKQLTGPFILRRVKTDPRVIQDLPEKLELKDYCHLTEEQATLYQAVVEDVMQQVESSEGMQRRGLVLSMLMQLKQICNHPVQYLHQGGKPGATARAELSGRSGKLERLVELLEEILAEGDRCLIFTQFAEMGELLTGYLPQTAGVPVQFLHGGTPTRLRDQMVRRFQEDDQGPPVFILSLKAGGTGLNLTRANHVFHFDRWWNPAVEDQATDRAFRIGQKRNVQVHKFVTVGTLEERIDELIESKKGLAQSVVGAGENWLTELSTADLRDVVRLRKG